jgi:hypothetical protein
MVLNVDILLHMIPLIPVQEHRLLGTLGQTCRAAYRKTQATSRELLLDLSTAFMKATLDHAAADSALQLAYPWSPLRPRGGSPKIAWDIRDALRTTQHELRDYLRWTYGLRRSFECSVYICYKSRSKTYYATRLLLHNIYVKGQDIRFPHFRPQQGNANALLSDLQFLALHGCAVVVRYTLETPGVEEAMRNPFIKAMEASSGVTRYDSVTSLTYSIGVSAH